MEETKSVSFMDMHSMQVEALMEFISDSLTLSAMTSSQDIMDDIEASADELVRLFGGNGVRLVPVD
tara:strand:- start:104 stop:301 length:198 start_codon:yes stop_codon:yes gene_type:complete